MYANGIALTTHHNDFIKRTLNDDFNTFENHFRVWKPKPNPKKTKLASVLLDSKKVKLHFFYGVNTIVLHMINTHSIWK